MDSIELMMQEHKYIIRMLKIVRVACNGILKGNEISYDDFNKMIDFIRNYADVHHHGKEEKILFKEMVDHLGKMGTNLVTHGMLVEHDLGRLYIRELNDALERVKSGDEESKLDVIANAIGYANHLNRHISKEDGFVYTYAAKQLEPEIIDYMNQQTESFEKDADEKGVQNKYINMLKELEVKYSV